VRQELRPVPVLEPGMIPDPLAPWLIDIAERISCPLDFPAVGALVALATVVGRKLAIRPKRYDDWAVVPKLWGLVVGRPGIMKTPALTEATRPLRRLEAEAREQHAEAMREFLAGQLVAEARSKAAKNALRAAAMDGKPREQLEAMARQVREAEGIGEPTVVRYATSDATVEKLGELLRDNPNGIANIRDELTGFFRALEKPGRESDRAFYLEGWNGTGPPFTYDRIGRGTIVIPPPCISLLGGIQPGPILRFIQAAARGEDGDDGLISRFQLLAWPDASGAWRNVDRWPDTEAKNWAFEIYRTLVTRSPSDFGARPDEDGGPPFLNFESEAQDLFDSWRTGLEAKLRTADESPLVESHLAKYRSLMPSLALLFHLVEVAVGWGVVPVTIRSATRAVAWCEYLEAHARRLYSCASQPALDAAGALAERIKQGALPSPFTHRDVYRRCWSGLDDAESVRRAVAVLEELGWLRSIEVRDTGGAPRVDVHVHPKLPRKAPEKT